MKKPWAQRFREALLGKPVEEIVAEERAKLSANMPPATPQSREGIPGRLHSDLIAPAERAWPEAGAVSGAMIVHAGPAATGADIYGTPVPEVPGAAAPPPGFVKGKIEQWRSGTTPVVIETAPGDEPKPKRKKTRRSK